MILSLIFPTRSVMPAPDRLTHCVTARLAVDGVFVQYPSVAALRDVSLTVAPGEVVCLLGPSGSGKSTLLRLVAGVERPTSGRIAIDGVEVAGPRTFVAPEKRAVGMVFQDFALFPHLTVTENVAFGLKGVSKGASAKRVAAMLERVGLTRYARSYPHSLSGGERQRVALARALAPCPRILLMDEPFSSLDGRLRDHVRQETMDLLRETGTTTIVVTHEPDEALRIADRIALLREGTLEQVGSPQELYTKPATMFAARFFSDVNELPGTCRDGRIETPLGTFDAPLSSTMAARVCIRPEHLRIASGPTSVPARVVRSEFRGEIDHVVLTVAGISTPVTLRVFGRTSLVPGDAVHLEVPEENVLVVPYEH
ncbi:MAG TPA: ABC transporter ATP-binding protein [Vicinamibacterales bacterium]|nr:ABC transporter ATP-binding protein [Vicinamibacterales bacterium]